MRLASFNVLHGEGSSAEELAAACASLDADVVGLQEIDRHQARSGYADQTEAVAKAMGAAAWRFEPALVGEPGGTWRVAGTGDGEDGEVAGYGVGLLSRRPVAEWHVIRLAAARVRSPVYVPTARRFILLNDEPRVALVAQIDMPAGPVIVATTHLSFVPGWNVWQLWQLTRQLGRMGHPCLLLGDLNLPAPLPGWLPGWRALAAAKTFPADRPALQIDHILGRGALPPVRDVSARRLPLSDHLALVADLGD